MGQIGFSYLAWKTFQLCLPVLSPPVLCGCRDNVKCLWCGIEIQLLVLKPWLCLWIPLGDGDFNKHSVLGSKTPTVSDAVGLGWGLIKFAFLINLHFENQWCTLDSSKSPWSPLIHTKVKVYFLPVQFVNQCEQFSGASVPRWLSDQDSFFHPCQISIGATAVGEGKKETEESHALIL